MTDLWPADFVAGWVRLYPPQSTKGHLPALVGEEILRRAFESVNEDGRLWKRLPDPQKVDRAKMLAEGLNREQRERRRKVLGVR